VRSFKRITPAALQRLARIAQADREDFFKRYPRWSALYSKRLLCVALCQGAALHYVDGKNGVKDFDVWSFFRAKPGQRLPRRPVAHRDFEMPKFGKSQGTQDFVGKRVDLILKSIKCSLTAAPSLRFSNTLKHDAPRPHVALERRRL
jgi:hypothetical protein